MLVKLLLKHGNVRFIVVVDATKFSLVDIQDSRKEDKVGDIKDQINETNEQKVSTKLDSSE